MGDDIFYNILCESLNLPDKINELKKEYKKYDIFISYRHDGGQYLALLFEHLREKGLKVFLDVESLKVGHFDEQIYNEIERRNIFVCCFTRLCKEVSGSQPTWLERISRAVSGSKFFQCIWRGFRLPIRNILTVF